MKKLFVAIVAVLLIAAIATAVILILNKDDCPVYISSVAYRELDNRAIASYLYFGNTDSREIDEVCFSIELYAGKDLIKRFNHTHDGNIDAGSLSAESVWRDYFPSSQYTYSDITKVNIAITSYKFVGEKKEVVNTPRWKSY